MTNMMWIVLKRGLARVKFDRDRERGKEALGMANGGIII